ncbi:alpha/beta fold hydrolase [Nocardia panacis]|uniref:alpha/beta fold hydrolase n=1 Tax=Nocardia panacis TaxID=2340916 RepID=UPI00193AB7E8|nr:alpha/beta hydrolase [Nocardia panacis]
MNDLTLSVQDEGQGRPVLLLHGFPDSADLWRHQIPRLTQAGFRVIAPDLRGFGQSDAPADVAAYKFRSVLADVLGVLDILSIDRIDIIGHDFGAALAWMAAMVAPHRVTSIAALSVGHPGAFADINLEQMQRSWYMFLLQSPSAERWLRRDNWLRLRTWLASSPDLNRYLDAFAAPGRFEAALSWYRANAVMPASGPSAYPEVSVPVLGVWGASDAMLAEEQMTGSATFVSGSWRYEQVPEAGHWLPLDCPNRLTELLLDFLAASAV